MTDAHRIAAEADQRAREARAVLEAPGFKDALARIEKHYLNEIRVSEPEQKDRRETAYFMLRAVDALRADLGAAMVGSAITQRNLRSRLGK
ncbi:hypothetical protein [Microcystis phage MJing1]|nr:hypothetical protein [Microcystis phage MJing1]